jgi:sensor histidine kinase YesM
METINQFQYIYENISLYQFQSDWIIFAIALVLGVILMVATYYLILATSLKSILYLAEQVLAKKKKTLSELILMKDIQTELEKEIEQAILKAAFHS